MSDIVERLRDYRSRRPFKLRGDLWFGPEDAEEAAEAITSLREALAPFVDLRHQPEAGNVILKALDGMAPVTVTVTKEQMHTAAKLIYCTALSTTEAK